MRRFGTLVHAVLATAPLTADGETLRSAAQVQGRCSALARTRWRQPAGTCAQALTHPLIEEAAAAQASGACYREWPVTAHTQEGMLVEGVIDLVFRDRGGAWCVVDFKTDREVEALADRYGAQLHAYGDALALALGVAPARLVLLRV